VNQVANKNLSIVIPTFNRSDFIGRSLEVHIPLARKYGIEIFISDNCSSDGTAEVVRSWKEEYPFLHYSRNETDIGAEGNFEVALNLSDTEYVWLFGDTYRVPEGGFEYMLNLFERNEYAAVVTNLIDKLDFPAKTYVDNSELLADVGGLMSCLSCLVLNKKLISAAAFARYHGSYFIHTGIVLEYVAAHNSKVYWAGDLSVLSLSSDTLNKKNWADTERVVEVGVEKWVNFIFSLPPQYSLASKLKAARSFGLLSWRGIGLMRANGFLTRGLIIRYRDAFKLAVSDQRKFYALFVICHFPVSLVRGGIETFRKYRSRNNA